MPRVLNLDCERGRFGRRAGIKRPLSKVTKAPTGDFLFHDGTDRAGAKPQNAQENLAPEDKAISKQQSAPENVVQEEKKVEQPQRQASSDNRSGNMSFRSRGRRRKKPKPRDKPSKAHGLSLSHQQKSSFGVNLEDGPDCSFISPGVGTSIQKELPGEDVAHKRPAKVTAEKGTRDRSLHPTETGKVLEKDTHRAEMLSRNRKASTPQKTARGEPVEKPNNGNVSRRTRSKNKPAHDPADMSVEKTITNQVSSPRGNIENLSHELAEVTVEKGLNRASTKRSIQKSASRDLAATKDKDTLSSPRSSIGARVEEVTHSPVEGPIVECRGASWLHRDWNRRIVKRTQESTSCKRRLSPTRAPTDAKRSVEQDVGWMDTVAAAHASPPKNRPLAPSPDGSEASQRSLPKSNQKDLSTLIEGFSKIETPSPCSQTQHDTDEEESERCPSRRTKARYFGSQEVSSTLLPLPVVEDPISFPSIAVGKSHLAQRLHCAVVASQRHQWDMSLPLETGQENPDSCVWRTANGETLVWEAHVLDYVRTGLTSRDLSSALYHIPKPVNLVSASDTSRLSVRLEVTLDVPNYDHGENTEMLGTLEDVMKLHCQFNLGPIPESTVAWITLQAIKIVGLLHQCGVTHNDLGLDSFVLFRRKKSSISSPGLPLDDSYSNYQWFMQVVGCGVKSEMMGKEHEPGAESAESQKYQAAANPESSNSRSSGGHCCRWHFERDLYSLANITWLLITGGVPFSWKNGRKGRVEPDSNSLVTKNQYLRGLLAWDELFGALLNPPCSSHGVHSVSWDELTKERCSDLESDDCGHAGLDEKTVGSSWSELSDACGLVKIVAEMGHTSGFSALEFAPDAPSLFFNRLMGHASPMANMGSRLSGENPQFSVKLQASPPHSSDHEVANPDGVRKENGKKTEVLDAIGAFRSQLKLKEKELHDDQVQIVNDVHSYYFDELERRRELDQRLQAMENALEAERRQNRCLRKTLKEQADSVALLKKSNKLWEKINSEQASKLQAAEGEVEALRTKNILEVKNKVGRIRSEHGRESNAYDRMKDTENTKKQNLERGLNRKTIQCSRSQARGQVEHPSSSRREQGSGPATASATRPEVNNGRKQTSPRGVDPLLLNSTTPTKRKWTVEAVTTKKKQKYIMDISCGLGQSNQMNSQSSDGASVTSRASASLNAPGSRRRPKHRANAIIPGQSLLTVKTSLGYANRRSPRRRSQSKAQQQLSIDDPSDSGSDSESRTS